MMYFCLEMNGDSKSVTTFIFKSISVVTIKIGIYLMFKISKGLFTMFNKFLSISLILISLNLYANELVDRNGQTNSGTNNVYSLMPDFLESLRADFVRIQGGEPISFDELSSLYKLERVSTLDSIYARTTEYFRANFPAPGDQLKESDKLNRRLSDGIAKLYMIKDRFDLTSSLYERSLNGEIHYSEIKQGEESSKEEKISGRLENHNKGETVKASGSELVTANNELRLLDNKEQLKKMIIDFYNEKVDFEYKPASRVNSINHLLSWYKGRARFSERYLNPPYVLQDMLLEVDKQSKINDYQLQIFERILNLIATFNKASRFMKAPMSEGNLSMEELSLKTVLRLQHDPKHEAVSKRFIQMLRMSNRISLGSNAYQLLTRTGWPYISEYSQGDMEAFDPRGTDGILKSYLKLLDFYGRYADGQSSTAKEVLGLYFKRLASDSEASFVSNVRNRMIRKEVEVLIDTISRASLGNRAIETEVIIKLLRRDELFRKHGTYFFEFGLTYILPRLKNDIKNADKIVDLIINSEKLSKLKWQNELGQEMSLEASKQIRKILGKYMGFEITYQAKKLTNRVGGLFLSAPKEISNKCRLTFKK